MTGDEHEPGQDIPDWYIAEIGRDDDEIHGAGLTTDDRCLLRLLARLDAHEARLAMIRQGIEAGIKDWKAGGVPDYMRTVGW